MESLIGLIILGALAWLLFGESRPAEETPTLECEGFGEKEVPFGATDPKTFAEYHGQPRVKALLNLTLDTVHYNSHPKILLVAPKGVGKTAVAKIFAAEYLKRKREFCPGQGRYREMIGSVVDTKADLDFHLRQIGLYDVIFMDEVHLLSRKMADTLLTALAENRYPFPEGMRTLPTAFAWVAATTDVGLLPEAFRDRFQVVNLDRLSEEDLQKIVLGQGGDLPTELPVAKAIAARAAGYPREIKRVYARARDVALQSGDSVVRIAHANRAFALIGLDSHGLYPEDLRVLRALYEHPKFYAPRKDGTRPMRYAQSERAIRAITGLDEALYRDSIEPKLLHLGLLTISSAGRELTDQGLALIKNYSDEAIPVDDEDNALPSDGTD